MDATRALTWPDVVRHAPALAHVEAGEDSWLGLACAQPGGAPVRVRIDHFVVRGEGYFAAITGGASAARMEPLDVIAWNARLPPGATVFIDDGCLWLRFLVPMSRLTATGLKKIIALLAREGARISVEPSVANENACGAVFSGFAE